jgi:ABC-type antimicrobial peptide transport system permease subunit
VQIVLALFGLVALIVSAIGMFNTMTIALLERINEIGIMRSIGASVGDIMK